MSDSAFDALRALDAAAREQAARRPPPSAPAAADGALLIGVAGRRVQIPMSQVRALQRCPPLARVPAARDWLVGMTAMDGRAIAVLDLARLAFERTTPVAASSTLLLCAVDEDRVGLLVEEVLESAVEVTAPAPAAGEWLQAEGEMLRVDVAALLAEVGRRGADRRPTRRWRPPPPERETADVG